MIYRLQVFKELPQKRPKKAHICPLSHPAAKAAGTGQIKPALGISGVYTKHSSWKFKGTDALPGAQIDMIIDRADQIIHLCEAKFTKENFALTNDYSARLRLKKSIFKQATQTKKAVFTTLLTTYAQVKELSKQLPKAERDWIDAIPEIFGRKWIAIPSRALKRAK